MTYQDSKSQPCLMNMSARLVSRRLHDETQNRNCDGESDVTVSSSPKLGHMLVLCLRRIIMLSCRQCDVGRTEGSGSESTEMILAMNFMHDSSKQR